MNARTIMAIALWAASIAMALAETENQGNEADTVQGGSLQEVTVKSLMPKTRVKGDAMRTIVAGSILEKAGTAADALGKIPGLKAERDGGVEVFGRGAAEVYINGRKVLDQSELSRLQSDQIQTVDVVSNPGARYAATTKAVVRIQLKRKQGEGWSFADYFDSYYQYGWTYMDDIDINYRTGGLDVTANLWAGNYGHNKSLQENDLTYFVGNDKYFSHSWQDTKGDWKGISPQLQINYQFNENHSIGAFYKYDRHPSTNYGGWLWTESYCNDDLLEHSASNITKDDSFTKHIFNAYYNGKVGKLGIDFNMDGLFDDTDNPNSTEETTTDTDGKKTIRRVNNFTTSKNKLWASKLVLSYPVWNGNLSVGGEYSHTSRTDIYSYSSAEALPVAETNGEIKENNASGFVEYGRSFGKLYTQVGLRYEHLSNDYYNFGKRQDEVCRNYNDWFPTVTLAMPVSFGEGKSPLQLSLSYRRDIERPSYSNLTSSTLYINKYTYQSGNPYLKPTYKHTLGFNATWKELTFATQYSRTKDAVTLLTEPYPGSTDPLLSLIHPVNSSDSYNRFIINPSYRPKFGIWHPMWSAGVIFQDYKSMTANDTMMTLNHPFGQFVWNNDFELPKDFRIGAVAQFTTKGDNDNFRMKCCTLNTRVSVQKDFNLRNAGKLTLDLRCYDIFNTNKSDATIYGIREITSTNPGRRTFQISASWKFNEANSKYRGSGAGEKQKSRMN